MSPTGEAADVVHDDRTPVRLRQLAQRRDEVRRRRVGFAGVRAARVWSMTRPQHGLAATG
jgi:hypothetical protein